MRYHPARLSSRASDHSGRYRRSGTQRAGPGVQVRQARIYRPPGKRGIHQRRLCTRAVDDRSRVLDRIV